MSLDPLAVHAQHLKVWWEVVPDHPPVKVDPLEIPTMVGSITLDVVQG
jgi:hypothetical protein